MTNIWWHIFCLLVHPRHKGNNTVEQMNSIHYQHSASRAELFTTYDRSTPQLLKGALCRWGREAHIKIAWTEEELPINFVSAMLKIFWCTFKAYQFAHSKMEGLHNATDPRLQYTTNTINYFQNFYCVTIKNLRKRNGIIFHHYMH